MESAPFTSWAPIDARDLPARGWLYGNHYVRKFASVTVSPGGVGKSTLVLAEAIAMATGRSILGIKPRCACRVVYFNAEDPIEEIQRRVLAICWHHKIDQSDLVGRLFVASGRDHELILQGSDGAVSEEVFALIEGYARAHDIDVFVFDPLANMVEGPETNEAFARLGKRLSRTADNLNCAIELVHHTRKLNGNVADIEDSRGGIALIGSVRSGRTLIPMLPEEAIRAGLDSHVDHFRIAARGKSNLSRNATLSKWFRRVGIRLDNGDNVASIEAWDWPDALEGVTGSDILKVQDRVSASEPPPRADSRAKDWIGRIVAEEIGLDLEKASDKARAKAIMDLWVGEKYLAVETVRDKVKGRDVRIVVRGPMTPMAEGAA